MSWKTRLFDTGKPGAWRDLGLLAMRLGFAGALIYGHGLGKLLEFAERSSRFSDPLGIGNPASLALVVFAEFFCALAVGFGFMGRLATVPLIINFIVAFFIQHGDDPFNKGEKAFMYLVAFVALLATGPGRFSIDGLIRRK
jgi:putative oxidoreductase